MNRSILSITDFLHADTCDWTGLPFKDKRKGKHWICRACGKMGVGRKQPECPASAIIERVKP